MGSEQIGIRIGDPIVHSESILLYFCEESSLLLPGFCSPVRALEYGGAKDCGSGEEAPPGSAGKALSRQTIEGPGPDCHVVARGGGGRGHYPGGLLASDRQPVRQLGR